MQQISFNLLNKKLKRYPHLNELKSFIKRIDKENLKLIMLYGSLAKGSYTQNSDIDVLCVYDKHFETMKERFLTSYKYSEGIVQPKTISYRELEEGLKEGDSFLHGIFNHGIILFSTIPDESLHNWIKKGKDRTKFKFYSPENNKSN
ncbi:MAG: nucleotidyltransferase domain-containing protein [Promethearchaeota archaeon]|nr:MAG: nucleotidyltransferase domain-containing protein [Candidatus Lokiarchaeota archaeon]